MKDYYLFQRPQNVFQLPTFPITNPRRKVLPENIDQIVDLVEEFRDFESEMENRDMYQEQRTFIDGDVGLEANPKTVLFRVRFCFWIKFIIRFVIILTLKLFV